MSTYWYLISDDIMELRIRHTIRILNSDRNNFHYGDCTNACGPCTLCMNLHCIDDTERFVGKCKEFSKINDLSNEEIHRRLVTNLLSLDAKLYPTIDDYFDALDDPATFDQW